MIGSKISDKECCRSEIQPVAILFGHNITHIIARSPSLFEGDLAITAAAALFGLDGA